MGPGPRPAPPTTAVYLLPRARGVPPATPLSNRWDGGLGGAGGSGLGAGARLALALQLEPWEGLRFVPWILGASAAVFIARTSQSVPRPAQGAILVATLFLSYTLSTADRDKLGQIHIQPAPSADASFALGVGETLRKEGVAKKARVLWPPAHLASERRLAGVPGSVSWKDGGEVLFDRQLSLDWVNELTLLCGVNPLDREFPRPSTERYGQLRLLRNNIDYHWSRRTAKQLLHASRDLGATHFVMREESPAANMACAMSCCNKANIRTQ